MITAVANSAPMYTPGSENVSDVASADFWSVSLELASTPHVWAWRARGGPVVAWTVRQDADRRNLAGQIDNFMFEGLTP